MAVNHSLSALFRDHGEKWEIEQVLPGSRWVACSRSGAPVQIIAAHDLNALRFRIEAAERDAATRAAGNGDAGGADE